MLPAGNGVTVACSWASTCSTAVSDSTGRSSVVRPRRCARRLTCDSRWEEARNAMDADRIDRFRSGANPPRTVLTKNGFIDRAKVRNLVPRPAAGKPCADRDGDGVPDAWEQRFFGCSTCADPGKVTPSGYLVMERGFSGLSSGRSLALPYAAAALGALSAGLAADKLGNRSAVVIAAALLIVYTGAIAWKLKDIPLAIVILLAWESWRSRAWVREVAMRFVRSKALFHPLHVLVGLALLAALAIRLTGGWKIGALSMTRAGGPLIAAALLAGVTRKREDHAAAAQLERGLRVERDVRDGCRRVVRGPDRTHRVPVPDEARGVREHGAALLEARQSARELGAEAIQVVAAELVDGNENHQRRARGRRLCRRHGQDGQNEQHGQNGQCGQNGREPQASPLPVLPFLPGLPAGWGERWQAHCAPAIIASRAALNSVPGRQLGKVVSLARR